MKKMKLSRIALWGMPIGMLTMLIEAALHGWKYATDSGYGRGIIYLACALYAIDIMLRLNRFLDKVDRGDAMRAAKRKAKNGKNEIS